MRIASAIFQQRAQLLSRLDCQIVEARLTPGCIDVYIVPALGPGAVAVVAGPTCIPRVSRGPTA